MKIEVPIELLQEATRILNRLPHKRSNNVAERLECCKSDELDFEDFHTRFDTESKD